MDMRQTLQQALIDIGKELVGEDVAFQLEHPEAVSHGDYATNLALVLTKKLKQSPLEIAETIKSRLLEKRIEAVESISVAPPGFVNIHLKPEFFINRLFRALSTDEIVKSSQLAGKKILVEYAHPNTHKEMHIGHMRTLITGEALSRLLEAAGAKLFRANYQGDIGPHIAKALYGIEVLMKERGLTLDEIESWSNKDKTHFLGEGYVRGNKDYEEKKDVIDNINMQLYAKSPEVMPLYERTRKWNLDYYDEFYSRFGTKFDRLFFESEMFDSGKKTVEEHIGDIFTRENGAVVFPGEKYGLHTRVFITKAGYPTYEGKEMGNAFAEYQAFPFDLKIHVVANEQAGYFQVVFKALELIDPEKFKDKQYHLSMGMVQLSDRKMSSRTGDIVTVDGLLDLVKEKVQELITEGRIESDKKAELAEQITLGAVKHSVLKVNTGQDAAFDINKSVSLEGDSGPYLQYAYARTQSVLRRANGKWQMANSKNEKDNHSLFAIRYSLNPEELQVLRLLARFDEVVIAAAENYSPNTLATYLYELAATFNLFYQKHPILKPTTPHPNLLPQEKGQETAPSPSEGESGGEGKTSVRDFRLALTAGVGKKLKQGLYLLGISAPEKM